MTGSADQVYGGGQQPPISELPPLPSGPVIPPIGDHGSPPPATSVDQQPVGHHEGTLPLTGAELGWLIPAVALACIAAFLLRLAKAGSR